MENIQELENLLRKNNYDDSVILGILHHIKINEKADILRLRVNGVDAIMSNGLSIEQVEKQFPNWNCEFVKIR